ncbi:MAG: tetratricopeptide repeat protein [Planctomycetota bacterium]
MTRRSRHIVLTFLLLLCQCLSASAELSKEQIYALFSQANESFRQANSIANDPDKARRLYEKAILNYERIIGDGRIRNPKLYYNLGNAYLLNGDLGNAILNYRRAELLDKTDTNLQKNLAFARNRRVDKVAVKTEKRILQTLFFWHYDLSIKTKFIIACICFAIACISLTFITWHGKAAPGIAAAVICGVLTTCLVASVLLESRARSRRVYGVVTSEMVVARQGDGRNYPESFKDPLHAGTEFDLIERRGGWLHIRLADNSDAWIPDNAAGLT